ncbi:MAG TPA: zinc ribbon domain-containing protein [Solirubrobacteraceae bacterium]|jgi:hypothetical protein
MAILAYFGINSSGLTLTVDLVIVFAVVLYLSLIYWTLADARRRIADPWLIACATVASAFPFVGTIIYMVLRPPEYLEDVHERELEIQAAEARLYELDYELCPHCDYRIERDFIRCPSCLRRLKDRCVSCSKPLDRTWTICPYCETEVPGSSARARRRRAGSEPETQAGKERSSGALAGAPTASGSSRAVPASARSNPQDPASTRPSVSANSDPEPTARPRSSSRPRPTP